MTVFMVPPLEEEEYPTLGPQVAEAIEDRLVFGPGDLRGQPAQLDDEKRALLYRAYEVYPRGFKDARGQLIEGRRRFRRVAISVRKGSAKTEFAMWIGATELDPEGPVRCDGFRGETPIGRPVVDPYIPLVATTEEQTEELAFGALYNILLESPIAHLFDIGLERIMRIHGDGKAVALATAPDARDGARTTWQHFDETHRFTLPRHKSAHRTMLANLPKRRLADPWALETTTAFTPGEGSVAEDTMTYARKVLEGITEDSRLFFFHRQAGDQHDLSTPDGVRAAVLEASGPVASWSDIEGICEQWQDPTSDFSYLERVYLNRPTQGSRRAFDLDAWKRLANKNYMPLPGAKITIGFDGSRFHDATGFIATEISTGFQWKLGGWEHDPRQMNWEVPEGEVESTLEAAFEIYDVVLVYADPPYWETPVARWAGRWGERKVIPFRTNRWTPMSYATRSFRNAMDSGEVTHADDPDFDRHIGNACKHVLTLRDDKGERLWVIEKERPDSVFKIDYGVAAILSWQARNDAIASGVLSAPPSWHGIIIPGGGS
jgi:hypothetical protein